MADNDKALLLIFDRRPTDDEMRFIHDTLNEILGETKSVAEMPKDKT